MSHKERRSSRFEISVKHLQSSRVRCFLGVCDHNSIDLLVFPLFVQALGCQHLLSLTSSCLVGA